MAWLKSYVLGKQARVKLYDIDRYERVVGEVHVRKWGVYRNVALAMVKAGYADIYTQQGAEYGGPDMLKKFQGALAVAKKSRRGMWSAKHVVLPSQFKQSQR